MLDEPNVVPLSRADGGEILTLQRAAYVSEAQAHADLTLPPLTQTLPQLLDELGSPAVLAFGIRDHARLVAAVRVMIEGSVGHLGRLVVAPDHQWNSFGSALLTAAETLVPSTITEMRLFTGEKSHANLRLYKRFGYSEVRRSRAGDYDLVHPAKPLSSDRS
ncbi:GNAT family N-acetyltransferase [Nocardia jiangxiensis]|uniref:GNAT family N-acetyltransferase n=1 Tax=Nocardia jiangxiensis TaxID=282685 RepID=A0ABW6S5X2_9NOCA|nr:GNAT family N-acetyltransferase [Nocardia jiangxiensis]